VNKKGKNPWFFILHCRSEMAIKFKKNFKGICTVLLIWGINIMTNHTPNNWVNFLEGTISMAFMIIAFQVHKYYYKQFSKNKQAYYHFAMWFIVLAICVFTQEYLLGKMQYVAESRKISLKLQMVHSMVFAIISISAPVLFSWVLSLKDKNKENELAIERLKNLNQEAKLSELKNQLNPHFLFNALSNIYSIAYLRDKQTPDKIMQLSKMLRYVIYETDVEFIALEKEINYLNYYIDFLKFRCSKEQNINFEQTNYDPHLKVAPLLFLPFLENAFKHSQIESDDKAWIKMSIYTKEKTIYFNIDNTISQRTPAEILNNQGIGLENIKNRLELIYKNRYNLTCISNEIFQVQLTINIHD
jgi:sensor histidine kinase YesM